MGMSASQARFLCLTARKNNVEFEGQQINQQRTTLSNESGSYYAELCNMKVPTPPSIDDYTKISYTFNDGALTNTISSMIAKGGSEYSISYIQQWQDDYSIVSASSSIIQKSGDDYKVGSTILRDLGSADTITSSQITLNGQVYTIKNDSTGPYVEEMQVVNSVEECTEADIANFEYFQYDTTTEELTQVYKNGDNSFYTLDSEGNSTTLEGVTEDNLIISLYDETQTDPERAILLVDKDEETGKYIKEAYVEQATNRYLTAAELLSITTYEDTYLKTLTPEQISDLMEQERYYQTMLNSTINNNPASTDEWMVRYVKDSTTGSYVPYFYQKSSVTNATYTDGYAQNNINCYSLGSTTRTKEIINAQGTVEKDSTGRYISICLFQTDADGNVKTDEAGNKLFIEYSLVTNTSTDEEAYNDAMNKYNYEQHQYDQKIQEINSKIEIIQQQDKSLELKLKQLDTEETAISTELEAVKKVITKNIESTFKTFNA